MCGNNNNNNNNGGQSRSSWSAEQGTMYVLYVVCGVPRYIYIFVCRITNHLSQNHSTFLTELTTSVRSIKYTTVDRRTPMSDSQPN